MGFEEETMPKEDFKILIGGTIMTWKISCRRGFPSNTYTANMKLTMFRGYGQGKDILSEQGGKQLYKEHVCFRKRVLESRPALLSGDAIEKLI